VTAVTWFTPHREAATRQLGQAWWWPGADGAFYGACMLGDSRSTYTETREYASGPLEVSWTEYSLLVFQLPSQEWDLLDDIYQMGNKRHRAVWPAIWSGHAIIDIPMSQMPGGFDVVDVAWRPTRFVWRQTPQDEKGLRQYLARAQYREQMMWRRSRSSNRRQRWRKLSVVTHQESKMHRRWARTYESVPQSARDFKLPAPHPYWTQETRDLLARAQRW
jgi:hypothetical protein